MPYDDKTGEYTPPQVSGYYPVDPYNFGAARAENAYRTRKPQFESRIVDRLPEGDIVAWKLIIEDTQGGLNVVHGRFDLDYDRCATSSLDTRFYNTLVLPQLTYESTTPDMSFGYGVHQTVYNGLIHVGHGLGGSVAGLVKENSANDPTMVNTGYTGLGGVTTLTALNVVSRSGTDYLYVGRAGGLVAQAIGPAGYATPTDTGIVNLNGIIQTFIGDQAFLVYYDGKIGTLSSTAAITTAPTPTLTSVPSGGRALGLVKLAGAPVRAAWLWPNRANDTNFTWGAKVVTTDQEGIGYSLVPMGIDVRVAAIFNDNSIIATDFRRVMYYDGRTQPRDLLQFTSRPPNSDREYSNGGFGINGQELIVYTSTHTQPGSTAGTQTQEWWEAYNVETNAWHEISKPVARVGSAYASQITPCATGYPIGPLTRRIHAYGYDGAVPPATPPPIWSSLYVPIYGQNPFYNLRQTEGAGTTTGTEFADAGVYTSPYWTLPGLEGCPSMVSRITFMGDVDAGGTNGNDATIRVIAGNMEATFGTGFGSSLNRRAQTVDMRDDGEVFYNLKVDIFATRNSGNTRWTPNALPVAIEGYSWVPRLEPPRGWVDDGR